MIKRDRERERERERERDRRQSDLISECVVESLDVCMCVWLCTGHNSIVHGVSSVHEQFHMCSFPF